MDSFPIKIDICPIVETAFEIRFRPCVPDDAVFGIVYNALKPIVSGDKVNTLPIMNIPIEVRRNDPKLLYQPYYQINRQNWVISVGPKTILFSNRKPYEGWDTYKKFVMNALNLLFQAKIFSQILRTGLRYINVIQEPLFESTNIELKLSDAKLETEETIMHINQTQSGGYLVGLQLNNNVRISIGGQSPQISSLIDIDVSQNQIMNNDTFQQKIQEIMEYSHTIEKSKFFKLLRPDFLEKLNPTYSERQPK